MQEIQDQSSCIYEMHYDEECSSSTGIASLNEKLSNDEIEHHIAYEVSVSKLELVDDEEEL